MKLKYSFYILLIFSIFTTKRSFSQANAGTDQEICTNHTFLNANTISGFTGEWSIISGGCSFADKFSNSTEITNLLSNTTTLKWTLSDGSTTSSDNVLITNNTATQAVTAGDEEICNNSLTINANIYGAGENGKWTVVLGSGTFANDAANTTNVSDLSLGINKFEWKISKGICSTKDTITITDNEVTANVEANKTICEDYTSISANEPSMGIGTWTIVSTSGNPIITDIHSPSTTITNLGTDTNSLQWTIVNEGCSDYDNLIVTNDKTTTATAGTDKTICTNTTNLSGNNPTDGTGQWSVVSGAGTFSNQDYYNTQVSSVNVGTNTYKWKITKNACSSEDEVEIYYDYFEANAGDDAETCQNSYTLSANMLSGATGEWRVTGGSGTFADANSNSTEVTNIGNGANTYEWKLTRGSCNHTDYVTITRNTPSTAVAGEDKETCNGTTSLSASEPAIGTGSWSVTSGTGIFANSLQTNTSVSNVGLGTNVYRWSVSFDVCSNYDEVNVVNNFVTTNAGADQIICGTTSFLSAIPLQADETGNWEVLEGGGNVINVNQNNSEVENLAYGNNRFKWEITKGLCSASDEVAIQNNKYNASATISGPSNICEDYTSIIGNSPPENAIGYWQVQSGNGTLDNSNDNSTVVRNLSLGENTIRWTVEKDGCTNYDEISINRNTVFSNSGEDFAICKSTTTLNAVPENSEETGTWSVSGGSGQITSPNDYNSEVTNLSIGSNTLTWTIEGNGCSASDNLIITNNKFYISVGANQQLCQNNTTINASNVGIGYWEVISGAGTFSDVSNHYTTVTNIPEYSTNTYRWHAFLNGCTDTDDIEITNNIVSANAGSDFSVCNNSATLNATNPIAGSGIWSNQAGAGNFADVNSNSTEVTGLSLGTNTYRWTVTHETCETYDDVTIDNNDISVSAGANQEICDDYTQLSGGQPPVGETGLWEIVSGSVNFEDANLYNTNITNIQQGENLLRWTINNSGCTSNAGEVIITNKGFVADAGEDQVLDDFVTSTNLNSVLPTGASAYWMLVGGYGDITDINNPNTEITNMETGINQFSWTVSKNGCTEEDIVNVTVVNFTPNAGIDRIICSDEVKLSSADAGGTPQVWSVISGSGTFDNPNLYNTWVRNVGVGTNVYRWTVNKNGAIAYDEMTVTRIIAEAGENQTVTSSNVTLNGNIPPENCAGTWSKLSGTGVINSPTLFNTEVTNLSSNNNIFEWTISSNECIISDYVEIFYDTSSDVSSLKNNLTIFPNPNNGLFTISSEDGVAYNVKIFNLLGKIIYSEENIVENNHNLDISNYKNGLYFLEVIKNDIKSIIKIIKK